MADINKIRTDLYSDIDFNYYFITNDIHPSNTLFSYFNILEEHYHFLAYMSKLIDDGKIIDTGTHRGGSSLALSYNKSNTVYTYDIQEYKGGIANNVRNVPSNIISHCPHSILDLMRNDPEQILSSDIFFVDIDHEGSDEMQLFEFLLENNYAGILILDDIHLNQQMKNLWADITSRDVVSFDVTSIAHRIDNGGTGVIFIDKSHSLIEKIGELT
jgi:predicted O-methyltransferase YrrM